MIIIRKNYTKFSVLMFVLILTSIITMFRMGNWYKVELVIYLICFLLLNTFYRINKKVPFIFFISKHKTIFAGWAFAVFNLCFLNYFIDNNFTFVDLRRLILWFLSLCICYSVIDVCSEDIPVNILKTIWLFIFFNVICSFYEYFVKSNPFSFLFISIMRQTSSLSYRPSALYANPIPFGTAMAMAFWLTFYLYKGKKKWLYGIAILLAIVLNKSRGVWIGLAASFALQLFRYFFIDTKVTIRKVLTIVCVPVILGLAFTYIPFLHSFLIIILDRMSEISGSVSEGQRIGTILYLYGHMRNNSTLYHWIFGHGAGYAWKTISGTTIILKDFTTTDNQYITLLCDYGLITVILMVFIFIYLCIDFCNKKKTNIEHSIDLSLITFMVVSFFFESLNFSNVCIFAFFLIAFKLYLLDNRFLCNSKPDNLANSF